MRYASGMVVGLEHSHDDTHAGSARIQEYLTCAHVRFVGIRLIVICGGA